MGDHAGQLGSSFVHLLHRARPSELDDKVLTFDVPEIPQARPKRLDSVRRSRGGAEPQVSEARHFGLRLCARNQRGHANNAVPDTINSRRLMLVTGVASVRSSGLRNAVSAETA